MATALVWGSTGGIGEATASALLEQGHSVIGVSRSGQLPERDGYIALEADFADNFSVRQAVMGAAQHSDGVDLMVYAAGDIHSAKVGDLHELDWRRILDANLTGVYLTTHHSLPLLTPDATIIFLGAIHERLRLPGLSAYAAAKAGLEAFADALTKEERKRKILVVRPGAVATPLWDKVPLRLPKDASQADALAHRVLTAWTDRQTGILDC